MSPLIHRLGSLLLAALLLVQGSASASIEIDSCCPEPCPRESPWCDLLDAASGCGICHLQAAPQGIQTYSMRLTHDPARGAHSDALWVSETVNGIWRPPIA